MPNHPDRSAPPREVAVFLRAAMLALCCGTCLAQQPPTPAPANFVTAEAIVLTTKTPLGDATINLPAGTTLTNFELQGDRVKIWQGPFVASIPVSDLPKPTPQPTPTPTPAKEETPMPEAASPPPRTVSGPTNASALGMPPWLLPAVVGALATYALLATAALIRARRRTSPPRTVCGPAGQPPVVTLPSKTTPSPAVVSDGGRAIACPLCGKNIPLEKVSKGRNHCPACGGKFVGE